MKIFKRDGREVNFNPIKIENAVMKAFIAVDGETTEYAVDKAKNIASYIENYCLQNNTSLTVEEIQDLVEHGLMSTKRKDVAKAYITYRNERDKERTKNSELRKRIREKLSASNTQPQNANVDEHSFGGRIGEASSEQMRDIALNEIISEKARKNHLENMIYIHDLDHYAVGDHNCLSIPFDHLLANGFNTRQTDVRPAQSVSTALQQFAVIFQLQSLQQFGGVSATHMDWTLVPYVRKSFRKHYINGLKYIENINDMELFNHIPIDASIEDGEYKIYPKTYQYAMDMTIRETNQAVEALYHNLNTLQSRSGNQLPFTSINYGTCTLPEGRIVIKALLEGSLKGVGKFHKTSIFPCGIFQCMKGVNRAPGDPNYDMFQLALKSTAQRLYPNYANVDWSGNAGYDINDPTTYFSTMGCRTANGWDINGFGQKKDGRGNICPVTIILPTLAMMLKERRKYPLEEECISITEEELNNSKQEYDIECFLNLLDEKIHEAKDMLIERIEYLCSQNPASARFMYENGLMAGYVPEEGIRSALKHGTLALGQLGLAETLQILIGCDHTTD